MSEGWEHRGSSLSQFVSLVAASEDVICFMKALLWCSLSLCVALGEYSICGSGGGGYPWPYPSRRPHLEVPAPSWSAIP